MRVPAQSTENNWTKRFDIREAAHSSSLRCKAAKHYSGAFNRSYIPADIDGDLSDTNWRRIIHSIASPIPSLLFVMSARCLSIPLSIFENGQPIHSKSSVVTRPFKATKTRNTLPPLRDHDPSKQRPFIPAQTTGAHLQCTVLTPGTPSQDATAQVTDKRHPIQPKEITQIRSPIP